MQWIATYRVKQVKAKITRRPEDCPKAGRPCPIENTRACKILTILRKDGYGYCVELISANEDLKGRQRAVMGSRVTKAIKKTTRKGKVDALGNIRDKLLTPLHRRESDIQSDVKK